MDSILKAKFVQLKEFFNFHSDIKNIMFYKKIKTIFNHSLFLLASTCLSFLLSIFLLNGVHSIPTNLVISMFFIPLFLSYLKKLNFQYQPKFTLLSNKLPRFLRFFPFVKSSEDSFFFSKEKISKMLEDKNCQLVFYDFFNMAKNNLFKFEEQKKFTQNIIFFKSFLESENYTKASDYFIELYGVAHQFEYMVYDDYQSSHDIQMLKTKKIILDEFLHKIDIEDYQQAETPSKKIYLTKAVTTQPNTENKNKVNWKKLMDD